jgi:hypothetical protein
VTQLFGDVVKSPGEKLLHDVFTMLTGGNLFNASLTLSIAKRHPHGFLCRFGNAEKWME